MLLQNITVFEKKFYERQRICVSEQKWLLSQSIIFVQQLNGDRNGEFLLMLLRLSFSLQIALWILRFPLFLCIVVRLHSPHILGLSILTNFTWNSYIKSIAKSVAMQAGSFYHVRHFHLLKSVIYIYKATIRPCLEHCCHLQARASAHCLHLLTDFKNAQSTQWFMISTLVFILSHI